jgi:hypothetical protein
MVKTSLKELTASCVSKLFDCAQPVDSTTQDPEYLGLRVNLEKDPQKGATLITTAEAICALAPHKDKEPQKFQRLIKGLNHLWKEHAESVDPDKRLNNRHIGWYALAMIEANQGEYLKDALNVCLRNAPSAGQPWADAVNRQHEVYSTWIVTRALISALRYLEEREYRQRAELVNLANQGLEYLIDSLTSDLGHGAPFTRDRGDRQHHESQPNPAMTAYVLTLLPFALQARDISFQRERLASAPIIEVYNTLADWENQMVWDSYREPYQPGSKEGDFEHFTTCWVARAFWLVLTSGIEVNEDIRRKWLWTLAKAMKGLIFELRVHDEAREGLIYVDRGSLRDYSFAVSDFLMLLNLIAAERIPDTHLHSYPDDILERLIKTSEIDVLVQDVSAFSNLSSAYTSYEVIIKRFAEEAKKEAAKVTSLKRQANSLDTQLTSTKNELTRYESQIQSLKEAKQDYFERFNREFGTFFTFFHFDWQDTTALIIAALCLVISTTNKTTGLADALLLFVGVISAMFCGGAIISDAVYRHKNNRKLLPLEYSLIVTILSITIILWYEFYGSMAGLTNQAQDMFGNFLDIGGGAMFIASFAYNIRRHKKKWDKFRGADFH